MKRKGLVGEGYGYGLFEPNVQYLFLPDSWSRTSYTQSGVALLIQQVSHTHTVSHTNIVNDWLTLALLDNAK